MISAEVTIENSEGIHIEPATLITKTAGQFSSSIHFKTEYTDINAKSMINLVSGLFRKGDVVTVVCDGPDEKEALNAMKELLTSELENYE